MAVSSSALTTLANLKTSLNITASDKDTILEQIIDSTTGWLEGVTNRKLKPRSYNGFGTAWSITSITSEDYFYVDGDCRAVDEHGHGVIYLPVPVIRQTITNALAFELAVLSGRSAGADGAGDTWSTTTLLEGQDYVVDYTNGKVTLLAGRFSTGIKNYRLKFTGGYYLAGAQPFVPADLERLCIELCKQMYKDSRTIQSESIGSWSRSYNVQVKDPFIQDIISKYTRYSL